MDGECSPRSSLPHRSPHGELSPEDPSLLHEQVMPLMPFLPVYTLHTVGSSRSSLSPAGTPWVGVSAAKLSFIPTSRALCAGTAAVRCLALILTLGSVPAWPRPCSVPWEPRAAGKPAQVTASPASALSQAWHRRAQRNSGMKMQQLQQWVPCCSSSLAAPEENRD